MHCEALGHAIDLCYSCKDYWSDTWCCVGLRGLWSMSDTIVDWECNELCEEVTMRLWVPWGVGGVTMRLWVPWGVWEVTMRLRILWSVREVLVRLKVLWDVEKAAWWLKMLWSMGEVSLAPFLSVQDWDWKALCVGKIGRVGTVATHSSIQHCLSLYSVIISYLFWIYTGNVSKGHHILQFKR